MNKKHQKCLFRPPSHTKSINKIKATNQKTGLIYILTAILFLVNMKVNFATILDFFFQFSKNSNKPPQMHRPVIRIDIRRKKNCAKKCLF